MSVMNSELTYCDSYNNFVTAELLNENSIILDSVLYNKRKSHYVCSGWSEAGSGWHLNSGPYPSYIIHKGKSVVTETNLSSYLKLNSLHQSLDDFDGLNDRTQGLPDYTSIVFKESVEQGTYRYVTNNGKYREWKRKTQCAVAVPLVTTITTGKSKSKKIREQREPSPSSSHPERYDNTVDVIKYPFRLSKHRNSKTQTIDDNANMAQTKRQPTTSESFPYDRGEFFSATQLALPPLDTPLISLSFDYEKIARKVKIWDESIRRDIRIRTENKLRLQAAGGEQHSIMGGPEGGFTIKSILHNCEHDCECSKYQPDAQHNLSRHSTFKKTMAATIPMLRKNCAAPLRALGNSTPPTSGSKTPNFSNFLTTSDTGGDTSMKTANLPSGLFNYLRNNSGFSASPLGFPRRRKQFKGCTPPLPASASLQEKKQNSVILSEI